MQAGATARRARSGLAAGQALQAPESAPTSAAKAIAPAGADLGLGALDRRRRRHLGGGETKRVELRIRRTGLRPVAEAIQPVREADECHGLWVGRRWVRRAPLPTRAVDARLATPVAYSRATTVPCHSWSHSPR